MEVILFGIVFMIVMVVLMSQPGSQYAPKPEAHEQLGIDPAVQLSAIAEGLGVHDSSFEASAWSFGHVRRGRTSRVTVELAPGPSDDVRTWSVRRVTLYDDAALPGQLSIGTRGPTDDEPEVDLPLPRGFQRAYWVDGSPTEVLATCDARLCGALLEAHRAAPRWTRVALGQSAVFERVPGGDEKLGALEAALPDLLAGADACVAALPGTSNLAILLARRARDDDEPLAVRWRVAHVLLTQMPYMKPSMELGAALDDLPDPLYHVCALWHRDYEGDPRDAESALVGALTGPLFDDGLPLYRALSEAGWDASSAARGELVRNGSDPLKALLREEGGAAGGLLTLAEEPAARGGLTEAADAGGLSPADEEV
jgi:hypothetical protein